MFSGFCDAENLLTHTHTHAHRNCVQGFSKNCVFYFANSQKCVYAYQIIFSLVLLTMSLLQSLKKSATSSTSWLIVYFCLQGLLRQKNS